MDFSKKSSTFARHWIAGGHGGDGRLGMNDAGRAKGNPERMDNVELKTIGYGSHYTGNVGRGGRKVGERDFLYSGRAVAGAEEAAAGEEPPHAETDGTAHAGEGHRGIVPLAGHSAALRVEPAGGGLAEKRIQCVHEQEYPFAERGGADCQPGAVPRDGRRAADTGVGEGGMDGGRADGYHLGHDGGRRNQQPEGPPGDCHAGILCALLDGHDAGGRGDGGGTAYGAVRLDADGQDEGGAGVRFLQEFRRGSVEELPVPEKEER